MATEVDLLVEARGWLADIDYDDEPDDLMDEDLYTNDQIRSAVHRHYDGGWGQFVAHTFPTNP